jgi:PKD repeat protein
MERDNLIQIVTLIIAIVALILALFSVVVSDGVEDTDDLENEAPTANITVASTSIEEMESLLFDASGSSDSDGVIVEYSWDFGDGGKDSGMYTNYEFSSANNYTVSLTVLDNEGETAITTTLISVYEKIVSANVAPTAIISVENNTVMELVSLLFDASGSSDPDGDIVEYSWDFGDGVKDSGMYTNHAFSTSNDYNVTLTVMDNDGDTATTTTEITVNEMPANVPPVASLLLSASSTDMYEHVNCDGSSSTDSDGEIVMYAWEFGDGINATGIYTNHYYTEPGTYTITLTVTDDRGATNSTSSNIIINDQGDPVDNNPPIASFEVEQITIIAEKPTLFNASGSSDSDGAIVEYSWDFGDGTGGSGKNIEHSFAAEGEFNVTLTVYDNDGASDSDYTIVTVEPKAPTGTLDFSRESYGNYSGGIITLSDELKIADAYIYILDDSLASSETQNPINIGTPFQVGSGLKLTFYDSNSNLKIDGGDDWEIENGSHLDLIRLVFKTGDTVAEYIIIQTAPVGVLSFTENTPGNYTGGLISLSSTLYVQEASITIIDVSTSESATQDPIQSGTPLQAGSGMTIKYTDSNGNGKMDAGDVWTVSNGGTGDVITLIFRATGSSIAQYALS